MAADGLAVLLGTVLEDGDFPGLAVLQDLGFDGSAVNHGSPEAGVLAVYNGQHLIEGYGVVGGDVQLLDEELVALADIVLFPTGNNNRLHSVLYLSVVSLWG